MHFGLRSACTTQPGRVARVCVPFEKWTQVFPDEMTATAVIERLVHHGAVFAFTGQSHRLRTRGKSSKNA
jgi:DNA replication protein DnaC